MSVPIHKHRHSHQVTQKIENKLLVPKKLNQNFHFQFLNAFFIHNSVIVISQISRVFRHVELLFCCFFGCLEMEMERAYKKINGS